MRWSVLLAIGLLLIPAGTAAPDHDDPGVEGKLHVHFTDEGPALNNAVPESAKLPAAPEAALCDTPLRWIAPFTQVPITDEVTWTQGLARDADMDPDVAPRLFWYLETVQPGGDEPMALPATELRLQATLRSGDTTDALGQGEALAHGQTVARPTAESVDGRHVYEMQVRMPWQVDNTTLPAEDGIHLDVRLDIPSGACDVAPVGWRAYSDSDNRPYLRYALFDPVRIDRLEPVVADGVRIVLHASSPWGRFDLADPAAPVLKGPTGEVELDDGTVLGDETLQAEWLWDSSTAVNGTYRIDAIVEDAARSTQATATAFFRIGGEPKDDPQPTQEPPKKKTPALPLAALLAGLALVTWRHRNH